MLSLSFIDPERTLVFSSSANSWLNRMIRLPEDWGYTLYKIYIVVGFVGIAAVGVITSILFDPFGIEGITLGASAACVTIYVLGILAYWWWNFLFQDYFRSDSLAGQPMETIPEVKHLKSWSTLSEAMSLYGGDVEEHLKLTKGAQRPIIIWFALVPNLAVILVFAHFWLGYFDIIPYGAQTRPYVIAVAIGFVVFALLLTYYLVGVSAEGGEKAYLKPLGLSVVDTSLSATGSVDSDSRNYIPGATVIAGTRHGRMVQIEASGKHSLTLVSGGIPHFAVHSQNGKLLPSEDAPDPVKSSLRSLRKAKRWIGIELLASQEGIAVERESKGQNMWLYDLWLAERLFEALEGTSTKLD